MEDSPDKSDHIKSKDIGNRIRTLAVDKGYSVVDLAKLYGCTRQNMSFILDNGPRTINAINRFADILDVSASYLMTGEKDVKK